MKLYATVTSERASKGQGGNQHLVAEFTVELKGVRTRVLTVDVRYHPDTGEYLVEATATHESDGDIAKLLFSRNENNHPLDYRLAQLGPAEEEDPKCCANPALYPTDRGNRCNNCGEYPDPVQAQMLGVAELVRLQAKEIGKRKGKKQKGKTGLTAKTYPQILEEWERNRK